MGQGGAEQGKMALTGPFLTYTGLTSKTQDSNRLGRFSRLTCHTVIQKFSARNILYDCIYPHQVSAYPPPTGLKRKNVMQINQGLKSDPNFTSNDLRTLYLTHVVHGIHTLFLILCWTLCLSIL